MPLTSEQIEIYRNRAGWLKDFEPPLRLNQVHELCDMAQRYLWIYEYISEGDGEFSIPLEPPRNPYPSTSAAFEGALDEARAVTPP